MPYNDQASPDGGGGDFIFSAASIAVPVHAYTAEPCRVMTCWRTWQPSQKANDQPNKPFRDDVLCRHGLTSVFEIKEDDATHEHAISNAWAMCREAVAA